MHAIEQQCVAFKKHSIKNEDASGEQHFTHGEAHSPPPAPTSNLHKKNGDVIMIWWDNTKRGYGGGTAAETWFRGPE
jgi:hypothetical protein